MSAFKLLTFFVRPPKLYSVKEIEIHLHYGVRSVNRSIGLRLFSAEQKRNRPLTGRFRRNCRKRFPEQICSTPTSHSVLDSGDVQLLDLCSIRAQAPGN